jgi:RHS repeat-associated protein
MWMDGLTQQREMLLSAHLTRGPPARGTFQAPITWVFEPESFAPMAKLVGGERLSIVTDHLGVPIAMHDAMGEEVWSAQIGTWGDLRRMTAGDAQDCPFRWPGQYEDIETGLYYNRFRYYDREAGSYVSQDPIGLAGGLTGYKYPHDPLVWYDPWGLKSCAARQQEMLEKNVGYNISHEEWFQNFSHVGRYGTFVTDKATFRKVMGHARPGQYSVGRTAGPGRVSGQQVRDFERQLGLEPGSLRKGFRITRVEGIRDMSPRSPPEGNRFFLGPRKGLPGGGPEIVIDPVPTS